MTPAGTHRQMMLGHLSELKDAETKLRIQIDTIWKQVVQSGDPMDMDLRYVEDLDTVRLEINITDIKRKKRELMGVLKEIAHTQAELGQEDDAR